MEFTLLHAGLAGGAALAAVPLVLHLLMRQTPKHVIFPALRLIRERQKQSKKRLRVKNWLLLLARMALFALMALALAQPTIHTRTSLGVEVVDTAIALVIDTSLSMQYTERGKNRLEEAKLRAADILKKATDRSEVWVVDTADAAGEGPVSPSIGLKRVEALTIRDANRPLNASVVNAYAALGKSNLQRKEVYVLTDLARSAWDVGSGSIAEAIRKANTPTPTIATYVLRLTPKEIRDVAIISADPVATVATQGERLEIKAKIRSWGPKATCVPLLFIDKSKRGDQKPIDLPENGEVDVSFFAPETLEPGLHQGEVRLGGGPDNMEFDDVRFFSFEVQPARRVLLVADDRRDRIAARNALDPEVDTPKPGVPRLYKVEEMNVEEFARKARSGLGEYVSVFLLNVSRLAEPEWGALSRYVREGGGVVAALGERVDPESYNAPIAAQLLPARIVKTRLEPPNTSFARPDLNHPIFHTYGRDLEAKLATVPVYRSWEVAEQGGRAILFYSDGAPAVLERIFQGGAGRVGHVLLWTTPFRSDDDPKKSWNYLPNDWQFLGVLLPTIPYLAGTAGEQLNYEAGTDALLPIDPARRSASYTVQSVDDPKQNERIGATPTADILVVPAPQRLGHWKVTGKAADGSAVDLGFSVNAQDREMNAAALKEDELVALFGAKENVQLADDAASLERVVRTGRFGTEMFPLLMFLILILVTLENLLANKFHRDRGPAASAAAPATVGARA